MTMGMRLINGLFAAMAAAAAAIALAPQQHPVLRPIAPRVHRRIKFSRRRARGVDYAAKPKHAPHKKRARICPTMRAIEEKRRAKVAGRALKAAA